MSAATRTAERLRASGRPGSGWTVLAALSPALVARFALGLHLANLDQLVAVAVAGLALLVLARHPAACLGALVVLLPFQLPLTALLYRLGAPGGVARMAALWKELVVVAVAIAAWRRSRGEARRIDHLDRATIAFVAVGTAYLVLPELFVGRPGTAVSLDTRFAAWRLLVLPSVLLCAARRVQLGADELRRVLRGATAMAFLLGVGALVESSAPGWWNRLLVQTVGVNRYRIDVLHLDLAALGQRADDIRVYGEVAGHQIVRAGGPMTSHLTFSFVLLIALAVVLERVLRSEITLPVVVAVVGCGIGLLVTQTRSSIVGGVVLLLVLLLPAPGRTGVARLRTGALVLGAALVVLPLVVGAGLAERFTQGDQYSDQVHSLHVHDAVSVVAHHPLGLGLGMGSTAGGRPVAGAVSVENQPLDTAVQLGVLGSLLLLAQYALLIRALGRAARGAGATARLGAIGVRTALIALLVPLWYQQAFGLVEVAWVLYALAGAALGAAEGDAAGPDRLAPTDELVGVAP